MVATHPRWFAQAGRHVAGVFARLGRRWLRRDVYLVTDDENRTAGWSGNAPYLDDSMRWDYGVRRRAIAGHRMWGRLNTVHAPHFVVWPSFELAALMVQPVEPFHDDMRDADHPGWQPTRIWRGRERVASDGDQRSNGAVGVRSFTPLEWKPLPLVSPEHRIAFVLIAGRSLIGWPGGYWHEWLLWADCWLRGEDRSAEAMEQLPEMVRRSRPYEGSVEDLDVAFARAYGEPHSPISHEPHEYSLAAAEAAAALLRALKAAERLAPDYPARARDQEERAWRGIGLADGRTEEDLELFVESQMVISEKDIRSQAIDESASDLAARQIVRGWMTLPRRHRWKEFKDLDHWAHCALHDATVDPGTGMEIWTVSPLPQEAEPHPAA